MLAYVFKWFKPGNMCDIRHISWFKPFKKPLLFKASVPKCFLETPNKRQRSNETSKLEKDTFVIPNSSE